jgi:hypothetical protein
MLHRKFVKSIFPARFAGQGVLDKDPTDLLDEARPPQIKSNYEFAKPKCENAT